MHCALLRSCNGSSFELRNKRKASRQKSFWVADSIVLNQVRVYQKRVYADNVVSKFWFVRSLSPQNYSKIITNITSENVSQIRAEECKTRTFFYKVSLNFLRSSRLYNCDTFFTVIVSFLNESVHGFNNIRNGR